MRIRAPAQCISSLDGMCPRPSSSYSSSLCLTVLWHGNSLRTSECSISRTLASVMYGAMSVRKGQLEHGVRRPYGDDIRHLLDGGGHFPEGLPIRCEERGWTTILQKRAPCSRASSTATWVCFGRPLNHSGGIVLLDVPRKSVPRTAMA